MHVSPPSSVSHKQVIRAKTHLQDTLHEGTARNTALQLVDFRPRLVDVERTNDNQPRRRDKVALGDRNLFRLGQGERSTCTMSIDAEQQFPSRLQAMPCNVTRLWAFGTMISLHPSKGLRELGSCHGNYPRGVIHRHTMYSQTHSMLYLSWAEMGTMGASSAHVPVGTKSHQTSWQPSAVFQKQQRPTSCQPVRGVLARTRDRLGAIMNLTNARLFRRLLYVSRSPFKYERRRVWEGASP